MSLRMEQQYSLQGALMRAFFVFDRNGRTIALGAVPSADSPGFCLMKGKKREADLGLMQSVARVTGIYPRVHLWHKGAKGRPRVLGVVNH